MKNITQYVELQNKNEKIGLFRPGDTIEVKIWVVEGNKKRLQSFEGVVISIRNRNINSSFTVYKVTHGEGVEKVFPTYSPVIYSVIVKRTGHVRKAKLYYLRNLSGKSARIKERLY